MIPTSAPTAIASSPRRLKIRLVGAVLLPIAHVEPGVVEVAAVGVLHHELADADQAATRARLVAELRLEVVELDGELAIALDDVAQQKGDDLLVGHRKDHVPVAAVLEPHQLGPDLVVAAAVLPHLGGVDDGHLQLLAADRVHLFANDLLDALGHPEPQRQQRVQPRAQLAHVPRPDQQPVGRHLGLRGVVAERGEEQVSTGAWREGYRRSRGAAVRAVAPVPAEELPGRERTRCRRWRVAGRGARSTPATDRRRRRHDAGRS